MGGKSTYIRSVGIAAILCQVGSFVPADSATMPLFDAVLTRVGAGDDPLRGVSSVSVVGLGSDPRCAGCGARCGCGHRSVAE